MVRILLFVGVGLGVLGVSMFGTLLAQGKLNREGLAGAGLLSLVFKAPEREPGEGASAPRPAATMSSLRPFTAKEITALVQDLQAQRTAWTEKRQQLETQEERLALYRRTLEQMKQEIMTERTDLAKEAADVDRREADLAAKLVLIKEAETENLRKTAAVYEGMSPDAAAQILARTGEVDATKVLSQMDERKAAKILMALPPEAAAKISERLKNLVTEPAANPPS